MQLQRVLGSLLVAPLLLTACASVPVGQLPVGPISVRAVPVTTGTIAGNVMYSGSVAARAKISILPKVAGQITALDVDVGSTVRKGDVIAELDHAALDAQVAQADAALAMANAKLLTLEAGSRPETIAQATANLDAAQANLAFLQGGGRPESVQSAEGNLVAAQARLAGLATGRPEAIAQAQANLSAAQARLAALKKGATPEDIRSAQLAIEQAKDAAYAADVNKDGACNPRNPQYLCDSAQAAAFAAHVAVDQAATKLQQLTNPPTAEQLQQARAAVTAAEAQLKQTQEPGSASDLAAARGGVETAQSQLALAKLPASTADLAKAQAAVDVARQQLKLAEQPFTPQELEVARAGVRQADAARQAARVARDQAIVTAPIDGFISERLLTAGSLAAPTSPIVTLIDPAVDVVLPVDETAGDLVRLGQSATVTSDALPGKTVAGAVTQIAPTVDPKTRTLQVKVTPSDPSVGLKDGMLVQVTLTTASHAGALMVPTNAVVQRNGQPTVYLVVGGVATPYAVAPGLTDGTNTEITSGLSAGDVVVVSGQEHLTIATPVAVQK